MPGRVRTNCTMRVTELDVQDWEPCEIKFDFFPAPVPLEFQAFVERWLRDDRFKAPVCECTFRYLEFPAQHENSITLRTEWACKVCVQALADFAKSEFPTLSNVELGLSPLRLATLDPQFVRIEGKEIEFEEGRRLTVKPFLIAKHPVSIGEFEEFVRATQYVTVAEQQSSDDTFRSHCGLSGLRGTALLRASVKFIAPNDAEAFCRYKGYRLPSEEEWFAAAIVEPGEFGPSRTYRRRLDLMKSDKAIFFSGSDITSTVTKDGLVVARRGPRYFLKEGWRDRMRFERQLIRPNHSNISLTFRVIKEMM